MAKKMGKIMKLRDGWKVRFAALWVVRGAEGLGLLRYGLLGGGMTDREVRSPAV